MGIGLAQIAEKILPLTVGDGKPVYRTNPATGQRFTFGELAMKAKETHQQFSIPYTENPYLQEEQHAFVGMG